MKKEMKVGEEIQCGFITIKCILEKNNPCACCYFIDTDCSTINNMLGECVGRLRSDGNDVCFQKVNKDGK